jgi:small-conductance mechanosensitive channel
MVVGYVWEWLVELVSESVTDIALAAIVLFSGLVIARIASLLIDTGLRTVRFNEALREGFSIPFNVSGILSQSVLWSVSTITVLWALSIIGISALVISALAILAVIIIAFSIIIALRDLIPNIIAGVEMHRKGFFSEGDTVSLDGERARVIGAGMLETILERDSIRIIIPNAMLLRREIIVEEPKNDDANEAPEQV